MASFYIEINFANMVVKRKKSVLTLFNNNYVWYN